MTERPVKEERSHWRDEALSLRHRNWGWNAPMVDIDFLVVEYSAGKARALIEYKSETAKIDFENNKSFDALSDLANRADLPFFIVQYDNILFSWFMVYPLNQRGKSVLKTVTKMTELEYVCFLYDLRGFELAPSSEVAEWIRKQHQRMVMQ